MKKKSLFLLMGMIFMGGSACYADQLPDGIYQQSCSQCHMINGTLWGWCHGGFSDPNDGAWVSTAWWSTLPIPSGYKGTVSNQGGKLTLDNK